ncbi:MAG: transposase [Verrucomicrobiales bacterium]|nr:transposase [Verrucomicrobiales bacterium]
MTIRNAADDATQPASVFVAALGASRKIYVEAFPDQKLASSITAHVRAFCFHGGVPAIIVPDETCTTVNETCRHDLFLHRT